MASLFDLATIDNQKGFGTSGAATTSAAGGAGGAASTAADIAGDVADIGIGIFATKAIGQTSADEQKLLDQQEQMAETQFYQQSLQRARRIREVMSQATAQEAARGVSVASPSFKSVQRSSFEKFREDQDVAALNLAFQKQQIETQKKIIRDKEKAAKTSVWGQVIKDIL